MLKLQSNSTKEHSFMRIWTDRKNNTVILKVAGVIDACTVGSLRKELEHIKDACKVFIDLSDVNFVNTFFVKSLSDQKDRLKDCKFFVINPNPLVLEMLGLMHVDRLASVVEHYTSDLTHISN